MTSSTNSLLNKHLKDTERAFKLMSLKNNSLDDQIMKLRLELKEKKEDLHEAYKMVLSLEEEAEAEKTILLSLRKTVRVEMEKGETLKKKIEDGNQQIESWHAKERENIERFEEETAMIIEKAQENHQINSAQEMANKMNNIKQKMAVSKEKTAFLDQKLKNLKIQLHNEQINSGWEGLDHVYSQVKAIPKDTLEIELNEEKHLMSTLQTLMRLYNKKKQHLQTIQDA